ncbi:MAG: hypothetical protein ACHQK8_01450 [Bacteroidia bacterium]
MRLILFLSFLTIIFVSCSDKKEPESGYFDTATFFKHEVFRLRQHSIKLQKELFFDERKKVINLDLVNWEKELSPFIAIDLCKPAYQGRFKLDSIFLPGNKLQITYLVKDPRSDLKHAEIILDEYGVPLSFNFIFRDENAIYASEKTMHYFTDSLYEIEGKQTVKIGKPAKYKVIARMIRPNSAGR